METDSLVCDINKNIDKDCSTDKYLIMGKPGCLVARVPVILCNFLLSDSINYNFNLHSNAIYSTIKNNELHISHSKINREPQKISIDGFIERTIASLILTKNRSTPFRAETKILNIPVHFEAPIKYKINPIYSNAVDSSNTSDISDNNSFHKRIDQEVLCEVNCFSIEEDSICKNPSHKNSYYTNFKINIGIELIQNQNVFIPEPSGDVFVISNNISNINGQKPLYNYLEIGTNSKNKIVAMKNSSF